MTNLILLSGVLGRRPLEPDANTMQGMGIPFGQVCAMPGLAWRYGNASTAPPNRSPELVESII